jgi:uncharacterized protein (TIRG00374 family)
MTQGDSMTTEARETLKEEPSRPDALDRFRRWTTIALVVAVLGWLAYAVVRGFRETAEELRDFNWLLYIPVLSLTLVNYTLRFFKWHYLLARIGVRIPVVTNAWVFTSGLAMVISPAKAGELVKPYLIRVLAKVPMSKTVPVLIAERLTDGLAVIILAAIGVGSYYSEGTKLIYTTLLVIVAIWGLFSIKQLAIACIRVFGRLPGTGSLAARLEVAYAATRECLAPIPFALMLTLSLVAWWAECIGYWIIFIGLDVDTSVAISTFLYSFATLFGAPSPGGMGMADVALAEGALSLIANLEPGKAIAASLLVRLATLWLGVILGAVALLRIETVIQNHRNTLALEEERCS